MAKKPKGDWPQEKTTSKPKFDPFADIPDSLLVAPIPNDSQTHNLVINKYPVIYNHFILSTKENKPQTHLLEQDDLSLTYECLKSWSDINNSLYAFFNSGEHSGASQAHRHLQLLPIEDMKGQAGDDDSWTILADTMTTPIISNLPFLHNPSLPFIHLAMKLDSSTSPSELHEKYTTLLKAAHAMTKSKSRSTISQTLQDLKSTPITNPSTNETSFSYNLALTNSTIAIFPRSKEGTNLKDLPEFDDLIQINGTILAGTLMVKSKPAWDMLRSQPHLIDDLLEEIGYPVIDQAGETGEDKS